jgi:hypothetical protein
MTMKATNTDLPREAIRLCRESGMQVSFANSIAAFGKGKKSSLLRGVPPC